MTLEQILVEWEKDAVIKQENLHQTLVEIPRLHHKYLTLYSHERLLLRKLEAELRVLNFNKWEFFTQGHNEDTKKKGWELPAKGKIIKSESSSYMDADEDLNKFKLRVALQQEKVDALAEIVKSINYRNYIVTNIINWSKWTGGN